MSKSKRLAGIMGLIFVVVFIAGIYAVRAKSEITTSANEKSGYTATGNTSVSGRYSCATGSAVSVSKDKSSMDTSMNTKKDISSSVTNKNQVIKIANGNSKLKNSRSDIGTNSNTKKIYYSNKVIALIYHHISNDNFSGITIKPERFESDLRMLHEKGFNVISFSHMLQAMEGNAEVPDNAVVITFDDGISSLYKYAFPLLKKYNLPATSFLITSRNEMYSNFKNPDNPLSPEEIKTMHDSGLIEFQSHTHQSHEKVYINSYLKKGPKLTNRIYDKVTKTYETNEEYEKRIISDLEKSSTIIEKYTGTKAIALCFPFGVYDKQVLQLAEQCGYKYFVTTQSGANVEKSNSNKIYRIRAGDAELTSKELYYSIIYAGK